MHGQEHAPVHLEVGGAGLVHAERDGRGRALRRLVRPRERRPAGVAPGQRAGVHRLGARDQHDVVLASAYGQAGVVHEGLWRVAPDGRQHHLGRLVALGEPEAGRHQQGGIGGRHPSGTTTRMLSARRTSVLPDGAAPPTGDPSQSSAADRKARTISSSGSGLSAGSSPASGGVTAWPTPTTTGVRGSRAMEGAAYRLTPRWFPGAPVDSVPMRVAVEGTP